MSLTQPETQNNPFDKLQHIGKKLTFQITEKERSLPRFTRARFSHQTLLIDIFGKNQTFLPQVFHYYPHNIAMLTQGQNLRVTAVNLPPQVGAYNTDKLYVEFYAVPNPDLVPPDKVTLYLLKEFGRDNKIALYLCPVTRLLYVDFIHVGAEFLRKKQDRTLLLEEEVLEWLSRQGIGFTNMISVKTIPDKNVNTIKSALSIIVPKIMAHR